ncbi:MAG: aminotransferase class V-fold PLP-dependent enzyme, partial [Proteobacteria bacterium]|nr:aminotransferase class V-fold PLP-dependent enzyme [Pseudomonadota bacterium]
YVHLSFSGLDAHNLVMALDAKGIGVSMGSACSALHPYPSHVLREIGLSEELALGSIRITTGLYTTSDDIEYVLNTLSSAVEDCRKSGIDREKLDEALREKITALQEDKGSCEPIKQMAWSYIFRKASSKIFKKRK